MTVLPAGGGKPELVATDGLVMPGGVAVATDGTVYVTNNALSRDGESIVTLNR
jgi:hypothetical protein